MLERSAEIDDLAGRIFLAEHFCSRQIQAPEPAEPAGEVRIWMELNDFDQAPLARTDGGRVVLRSDLIDGSPDRPVDELAIATPAEHWLESTTPLQQALEALAQRQWLLVRSGTALVGILTRHDLASPVVSSYLLARLLGLEQGVRRLYGSYTHQPLSDAPPEPPHDQSQELIVPSGELISNTSVASLSKLLNQVAKHEPLRSALGYGSHKRFKEAAGRAVTLRNHLAHGRSILSRWGQPADAVERIRGLEQLVTTVRQLLDDREHVWDAFAATEIVAMRDPAEVWAGGGALPLPLPAPVHVITAQNPHERVLNPQDNRRRHLLLGSYLSLRCCQAQWQEVVGQSCSGPWREASWAISGLSRADALAIGQRFQQRAIFELTATELLVIDLDDGAIRRRVPRKR